MSGVFDLLTTPVEDGVTVIEASAGTGKTYCLTGLVLRALLEKRVEHAGQLLVVTFTNAATDELVGRIRKTLAIARAVLTGELEPPDDFLAGIAERHGGAGAGDGAEILRHALLDIDDLTVATIHGFCKRVLDEAAFEGGLPFDVELVESDDDLWLDAARDVWRRLLGDAEVRASLLPAVIAEKGLVPESFRDDYRQWRRHPETVLLPPPLPVVEAAERLELARAAAASAFKPARWRLELSRLEETGRGELNGARLRAVLAAAAAFLEGRGDGLWALELLRAEQLRSAFGRGGHGVLERLPGAAELARFHLQLDAVHNALRGHVLTEVDERFDGAKRQAAAASFDDLLHQLRGALAHPSHGPRLRRAVRSRYRLALIDEFQDTDLVQYDIFRRLFEDGPLILVGDPKQAIYRFRGADVFAYLGAKREADRAYTLRRNWRSSENLVSAINAVFSHLPHPFVEDDIPFPAATAAPAAAGRRLEGDGRPGLVWLWTGREEQTARAEQRIAGVVASEVARLLEAGMTLEDAARDEDEARPLRPADVAVLVRTNAQARLLQDRLREVGVPAVLSRTGDIFRSRELEEVLRLLAAVLEPSDGGLLRAACSTVLWGEDAEALRALSTDDTAFQARVELFEDLRVRWQREGFVAMMETLLTERGVRHRLARLERGERRLTNLQHTVELAHQAAHDHHLSPAGLLAWLRAERRLEVHERGATELRLESDDAAVQLVTVHKAKGLEYEVVFCPFLWQARPVREAPVLVHETAERLVYDCGSERLARHLQMAEAERLAEDLRLTYVALTRARRRCYVVWGPIGRGPRSARSGLAWLLHRRQGRLEDAAGAGPEGDTLDAARRVADGLEDAAARHDDWLEDLRRLVTGHAGLMALEELDPEAAALPLAAEDEAATPLAAAEPSPRWAERLRPWRIASFSSLTRGAGHEQPDHRDPSSPAPEPSSEPRGLFAFARGPRAGDCLHQVLEDVDYTRAEGEEAREAVRRQLRRFRLSDPEAHARGRGREAALDPEAAVLTMLRRVLTRRLPGGLRLADVPRAERMVEWQFYAPLVRGAPRQLAETFRDLAGEPWAEEYAGRLEGLSEREVEGYLTGFIDLVAHSGGRWWLVDWKSNHLGDRAADYDTNAMTRAMIDHHYLLQAHLYALALDRYVRTRRPGWDYRRDFGGVYYIFLRGVEDAPSPPSSSPAAVPAPRAEASGAGQLDLFGATSEYLVPENLVSENLASENPAAEDLAAHDLGARELETAHGVFFLRPRRELIDALGERLVSASRPLAPVDAP